jgi:hypothetical protein
MPEAFSGGTGTEQNPYTIATSADLAELIRVFSSGDESYTSACYRQTGDISMSAISDFAPLKATFKGVYDGCGHSISGVRFSASSGPAGFWSSASGAVIRNLSLKDVDVSSEDFCLGAIVGKADGCEIISCSVSGKVHSLKKAEWDGWTAMCITADKDNFGICGGIVGMAENSTVSSCTFEGKVVTSGKCCGGIVGYIVRQSIVKDCRILPSSEVYTGYHVSGGIVGAMAGNSVIDACSSEALVGAYGGWAGGIVGLVQNGAVHACVTGSHGSVSQRLQNAGGIAGALQPRNGGTASVEACTAYCNVYGQYSVGGIVGLIDNSTVTNNDGKATVSGCSYVGGEIYVSGTNSGNYSLSGGIIGWVRKCNVTVSGCLSRPSAIMTSVQSADSNNAAAVCTGGIGGILGYNSSVVTMTGCYSTLAYPQVRHRYQALSTFADYRWYGGVYGRNTNSVKLKTCCYDETIQPRDNADNADAAELSAMSIKQMTDGTLLRKLNEAFSADNAFWIPGADSYPVPECIIADPNPVPAKRIRVSIIGDSISTFAGFIPSGFHYHYPAADGSLVDVSETYWYRLIYNKMSNAVLDKNISYSATTVSRLSDKYKDKYTYENDFCQRYIRLGGMGSPDVVIIHGGTNDRGHSDYELFPGSGPCSSASAPMAGDLDKIFAKADAALDRKAIEALPDNDFCSAYAKLIRLLSEQYPGVKIVGIIGDYITEGIEQSILQMASHYGFRTVNLLRVNGFNDQTFMPKHDYNGTTGCHPNAQAMAFIADKIYDELGPWLEN